MSTIVTRSGKGSPLTHAEVDSNFTNLNTDKLELSGGTMTGDVGHGDNVKATFGASADLQILHDGNASIIQDVGTGDLNIQGTNVGLRKSGAEYYLYGAADGAVTLYHDGNSKLSTTTSGINVTGTVVADGAAIGESTANTTVTVGGSYANGLELAQNGIDATSSARLFFDSTTDTSAIYNSGGDLTIAKGATVNSSSGSKSMTLGSNGDISFYDSAGVNTRFFWDASAESLGIGTGTGTPLGVMHLKDADSNFIFVRNGTETELKLYGGTNEDSALYFGDAADNVRVGFRHDSSANALRFMGYNNSEAMRIDSNGNVGIGTAAPNSAANLHIHSTSGTALWLTSNGGNPSDAGFIRMSEQLDGSGAYFELQHDGSNNMLNLYSSNQGATIQSWNRVNGDTNFHNSSGTAKLTWDATAEELQLASGVALELNGWTITESGGSLYFATGGTNKMKLDASGNLDVVGSVNANATIT